MSLKNELKQTRGEGQAYVVDFHVVNFLTTIDFFLPDFAISL